MLQRRRTPRGPVWLALALAGLGAFVGPRADARAQTLLGARALPNLDKLFESLLGATGRLTASAGGSLVRLFENLDMLDLKPEIDRMVGLPWELHDSTTVKLSLLPYKIRFPIYQQIIAQMTRQDALRSRRIHRVSASQVSAIVLRLDRLIADDPSDDLATARIAGDVRGALLTHFDAREMMDLGVYVLAQQPFFPEDDAGWQAIKQRVSDARWALAGGALGLGALVNAGAFGQSGALLRARDGTRELGYYGAFRRLGMQLRPELRAGLTGRLPGVELAAGWLENVNASSSAAWSALEFAAREGFLGQLTAPQGWDVFAETALRANLRHGARFEGEHTTGRAGLFVKRDALPAWPTIGLRGTAELESDFVREARFATGLGVLHEPSGLSTILQVSRTRDLETRTLIDTRGGLFLAGSTEPPTQGFVDGMLGAAELVRHVWDALAQLDLTIAELDLRAQTAAATGLDEEERRRLGAARAVAEQERRETTLALAARLSVYLRARRLAYSLERRTHAPDDLHGPLQAEILAGATRRVLVELAEVRALLSHLLGDADRLTARRRDLERALGRADAPPETGTATGARAALEWERAALTRTLQRHAARARALEELYAQLLQHAQGIASAHGAHPVVGASGAPPAELSRPLDARERRRLVALQLQNP